MTGPQSHPATVTVPKLTPTEEALVRSLREELITVEDLVICLRAINVIEGRA